MCKTHWLLAVNRTTTNAYLAPTAKVSHDEIIRFYSESWVRTQETSGPFQEHGPLSGFVGDAGSVSSLGSTKLKNPTGSVVSK